MLRLIYDEDKTDSAGCVRTIASEIRLMVAENKRLRANFNHLSCCKAAVGYLENYAKMLDNATETCDNIGNLYKFHITEQCAYDEGYNAAIREVLSLLKKGDNNAEDF